MEFLKTKENRLTRDKEYLAALEDPITFWDKYEFDMPSWYDDGWEPSN